MKMSRRAKRMQRNHKRNKASGTLNLTALMPLNTPSMIGVIELLKISKVAFTLSVILLLFSNSVLYVLNCSVAPSKLGNNAVAYA